MVPASTMKILTALAAIRHWGLAHRFHTDFYLGKDGRLWVRGYGDPYLVSEELDRIVAALRTRGVRKIAGIGLDDSYFDPALTISGRSASNNPYDAPVTALAANFNTVNIVNQTNVRHILVRTNEIVSDDDARTRLAQLRLRIVGGDDFATLARSHSDDTGSALKGGSLGWIGPGTR